MKRLTILITLCTMCINMLAQGISGYDKPTRKILLSAEKFIENFHCDSVVMAYTIYDIFRKKEFKDAKFTEFPTWEQLQEYIDFKHPVLDYVLAKTTDNEIWLLMGVRKNFDGEFYAYSQSADKDKSFFEYLETKKPEKVYSLFGQGHFVLENNGKRVLYYRRQEAEVKDLYKDRENGLDFFNRYEFPKDKQTNLMKDYGK